MSALTIRNLPEPVHAALRRIAAERHTSVEALARQALSDLPCPAGTEALDDPALSRRVLGVDDA